MNRSRLVLACVAGLLVVLSAPWSQQLSEALMRVWPAQFRAIAMAATALPIAAALIAAMVRIRDRRALRYTLLALSVATGAVYIVLGAVGFGEACHFVEYGLVAILLLPRLPAAGRCRRARAAAAGRGDGWGAR